jgi:hypothetical protein
MPSSHPVRARAALLILLVAAVIPGAARAAADAPPATPGPEGRQAYDDLTRHYRGQGQPPFAAALKELKSGDEARRARAGRYLAALLRQAFADDRSGRGPCRRTPFFGGGAVCDARELRRALSQAFGAEAGGAAAFDAAAWLIDEEQVAENQAAGLAALARIDSPRAVELLRRLLAAPHPNEDVLTRAIELAGARRLGGLGPALAALCRSPRPGVRAAATRAAAAVKATLPETCGAPGALPPAWQAELRAIDAMVLTKVPPGARWVRLTHTHPRDRVGGKPVITQVHGFVLAEDADAWRVLDVFAQERRLPKRETAARTGSLVDEARELIALRARSGRELIEALSARGGLTGQFQPPFISLPEALVAAWLPGRGEGALAAALLVPRIGATRDDRWIGWAVRDLLGHHYHQELLLAFSHERDYGRALELARHLAGPRFAEYEYQERARELAAQLAARRDDFTTLTLPGPAAWAKLRAGLSRAEQVGYLAARLRLLNCIQWGQPGGVSYQDPQHAVSQARLAAGGGVRPEPVINPFTELLALKLTVAELPLLVPRLADESFMPTFSYWRDFHPQRTLHRVSWAVAEVVNAVAQRDLADLAAYQAADAAGRARHLARIVDWCRANSTKSPAELVRQTIAGAAGFAEVQAATRVALQSRDAAALPVVLGRLKDFRDRREELARLAYAFGSAALVPTARSWLADPDEGVRFFGALTLLRRGNRAGLEGLAELRPILLADDGSQRYPEAFDALMDTGARPAIDLAAGFLAKPHFDTYGHEEAILRLFLAGRREALDYVLLGLASREDGGTSSGSYRGADVERPQVKGDRFASMVASWQRGGGAAYDVLAPDAARAAERARLAGWLRAQHALIQAGKPPAMRTKTAPLVRGEWQVDVP